MESFLFFFDLIFDFIRILEGEKESDPKPPQPRKRGRPKKNARITIQEGGENKKPEEDGAKDEEEEEAASKKAMLDEDAPPVAKRGRGRPKGSTKKRGRKPKGSQNN